MTSNNKDNNESNGTYNLIHKRRSSLKKFSTNQTVTTFSINNLGEEPDFEFARIIDKMIDEAFEYAEQEFRRTPSAYIFLLDGTGLDVPIRVTFRDRSYGMDIHQVNSKISKYK